MAGDFEERKRYLLKKKRTKFRVRGGVRRVLVKKRIWGGGGVDEEIIFFKTKKLIF